MPHPGEPLIVRQKSDGRIPRFEPLKSAELPKRFERTKWLRRWLRIKRLWTTWAGRSTRAWPIGIGEEKVISESRVGRGGELDLNPVR